jgi:NDP-sugar pyrophosphorylase family protein
MKAMIFAAGVGNRLKPITNTKPKALAEINGITLLEITIKRLISSGFNDIIINVHHFADQIINFLYENKNFGASVTISDETEQLLDTGGGLKKAAWFFNDGKPFLVHNVDIISNINLNALYQVHCNTPHCIATLAGKERKASREFLINADNELCGWKNIITGEIKIVKNKHLFLKPIAFCGIHIISPEIFGYFNTTNIFSIINTYLHLAAKHTIKLNLFNDDFWMDLGTPANLKKASKLYVQESF